MSSYYKPIYTGQLRCPYSHHPISWAVNRYVGPDESRQFSDKEVVDLVSRISMTVWQCDCLLGANRSTELSERHSVFTPSWLYSRQGHTTTLMSSTPEETLEALCSAHIEDGLSRMKIYEAGNEMRGRARKITPRDKEIPDFTLIAVDERMVSESQSVAASGLAEKLFLSVTPFVGAASIPLVTLPVTYPDPPNTSGRSRCDLDVPEAIPVGWDQNPKCQLS